MKFISPRVHGLLDYVVAALLVCSPWLFGFNYGSSETIVPVALGGFTIIYSLFTQYVRGVFPLLPFRGHLALDCLQALLLGISPWLFNFWQQVYWPHIVIAVMELTVVLSTKTTNHYDVHQLTISKKQIHHP